MAHVTDYDVWHETEEAVTVEAVIKTLMHNAEVAVQAVANAIALLSGSGPSPFADALQDALMTSKDVVPRRVIDRLELLIGKYYDRA